MLKDFQRLLGDQHAELMLPVFSRYFRGLHPGPIPSVIETDALKFKKRIYDIVSVYSKKRQSSSNSNNGSSSSKGSNDDIATQAETEKNIAELHDLLQGLPRRLFRMINDVLFKHCE